MSDDKMDALVERDRVRIYHRAIAFWEPSDVERWLMSPQPLLDGKSPNELIDAGNAAEVDRMLDQLDDCVYL